MRAVTRRWRNCIRITAAAAVLAGATGAAGTAAASGPASPGRPVRARGGRAAAAVLLTPGQALARARATGRPVTVTAMTTPTSQTTASPRGTLTTTASIMPVRTFQGGRWRPLNAVLHRAAGGRISPQATPDGVSLSGGGTGPLAVLFSYGLTLTLTWPGPLPPPSVSGATATYANVPVPGASLLVTVSPQGSVSTVIEITSPAAAASPALATLRFGTSSPGLTLSSSDSGLSFASGPGAVPAFTIPAPRMWDSAPLPAGTPTVTDPSSGEVLAVPTGLPAQSGISGPGAAAHVTAVPVTVSGGTITMSPPAAALTGPDVTYPVFIDPTLAATTVHGAAWTQIDSGLPGDTSGWMQSGCLNGSGGPCLQSGFCDPTGPYMSGCGSLGVTRTMIRMAWPALPAGAVISSADLYLDNVWTAACSAQKVQVWTTPAISSSTDWSNASSWGTNLEDESFNGYGSTCGPPSSLSDVAFGTDSGTKIGVSITGGSASALAAVIQHDVTRSITNQTVGLRASSESTAPCDWSYYTTPNACQGSGTAYLQWRQWMNKSSSMELQFTWHTPPGTPADPASSPGGSCHASAANEAQIGNDDMSFSATAGDSDGDTNLTTTFSIYAYDTGKLVDTLSASGAGALQTPTILRSTIQAWQATGTTTAYRYYYTAYTTNSAGDKSPLAGPCYFFYNPAGPPAPIVTGLPGAVTLGQSVSGVTFAPGMTGCPGPSTCPASYTYQIGAGRPVTVTPSSPGTGTWDTTTDTWTGTITIGVLGPFQFSVTSTSTAGNPGEPYAQPVTSTPGSPLADGYFSAGKYPDVLFTGTGAKPSLWLAQGTGNGTVGAPVDIGSLGNMISPGSDGPGDWKGALILHGDLTGNHVQDVMAYWPAATQIGTAQVTTGTGTILAGTGAAITVNPQAAFWPSGSQWNLPAGSLCDFYLDNCVAEPTDLVAAGNASQTSGSPGPADLIGVLGDSTRGWELNLYTAAGPPNSYTLATTLAGTASPAPDGTSDWNNYTLATYQQPDAGHPHGDPMRTVLLALDKATGALYESVNPNAGNPPAGVNCMSDPSACTLIGTPASTWTKITVPWGSAPPALISADVNSGAAGPGSGTPEIWTAAGTTLTAYALTGTTLTAEASSSIATPSNDWPLTDGNPVLGVNATTAIDTITGTPAALSGRYGWTSDPTFSTILDLSGTTASNAYMTPPAGTLPDGKTTMSISLWFKTTSHDGVLASIQAQAPAAGPTTTGGYDPVLYIGNDGKLHGQWWNGTISPISSSQPVDNGLWHHAVLTATTASGTTTQTLWLDGQNQGTITGPINLAAIGSPTNLTFGAGYIGGSWPSENHYKQNGNTGYLDYLNGQLADITLTYP
ncbi:MAG: laminin G domain-containing protein [Actinomycetota bacterium]|nr:laminin G domain-containing protein [Actinomycetota bacterium]